LFPLKACHTGWVTKYSAGVIGRRRAAGKTSAHPADALFVKSESSGEELSGCHGHSETDGVLEKHFFHYY